MNGKVVHVLSGEPYDLYIGRAMPRYGLEKSRWANHLKVGRDGSREEVLRGYEMALSSRWRFIASDVGELRGKTLACWCAFKNRPLTSEDKEICHGQVLLRLAEEAS